MTSTPSDRKASARIWTDPVAPAGAEMSAHPMLFPSTATAYCRTRPIRLLSVLFKTFLHQVEGVPLSQSQRTPKHGMLAIDSHSKPLTTTSTTATAHVV